MVIQRDSYLRQLVAYRGDGQVKVITGIRRSGKSYLLMNIYRSYLIDSGVPADHIIVIQLDLARDIRYRDPLELSRHVRNVIADSTRPWYLFIDEIQMSDEVPNPYNPAGRAVTFYDAVNDLNSIPNLDIYVTGSNSRMLSSDVLTQFRGRSDEIRVHPLCFSEYYAAVGGDRGTAYDDYAFFGGMPLVLSRPDDASKMDYLKSLFTEVYIKDIVERDKIGRKDVLAQVVDVLCSAVGSLTNPTRIADTVNTKRSRSDPTVSSNTIRSYINHLEDTFLFSQSKRYDVKGRAYLDTPYKYYCEDIGLRNARLGFRQQEASHIMENIIYNELVCRRMSVDIGVVYARERNAGGNSVRVPCEIDFVVNANGHRTYIQSAYAMPTQEKSDQELRPLALTGDSFPKIVIRTDTGRRWYDETGVLHINLMDFLLDKSLPA